MTFSVRPILSIISILFIAGNTWAEATTSVSTEAKKEKAWSLNLNTTRSTSLIDFQDGTRKDGMDYGFNFGWKVTPNYSLGVVGGYSQDLNYPESNDFNNTNVSLARKAQDLNSTMKWGYKLGAVMPTSKDAYKRQNLITSLAAGLSISANPDILPEGLEIGGGVNMTRNIHQYETALDGRVNTRYASAQSLSVAYGFSSGISISAEFLHRNTWSYQNVMRESFSISEELGYAISPMWAVAVGHTNEGSALRANGVDSNFEVVNENNSIVYGTVSATF